VSARQLTKRPACRSLRPSWAKWCGQDSDDEGNEIASTQRSAVAPTHFAGARAVVRDRRRPHVRASENDQAGHGADPTYVEMRTGRMSLAEWLAAHEPVGDILMQCISKLNDDVIHNSREPRIANQREQKGMGCGVRCASGMPTS
jgi:hypothetical protein